MYVNLEIAALFPSLYSRVKKGGNFKTNINLDSVESFLYYPKASFKDKNGPSEQTFCDKNYAKITLGIKIV